MVSWVLTYNDRIVVSSGVSIPLLFLDAVVLEFVGWCLMSSILTVE
jgi:hypothetical protein